MPRCRWAQPAWIRSLYRAIENRSAIRQGRVAAASMNIVAKRPADSMKGVILAGLVETYAVLALLISVLAVFAIPGIAA